MSKTNPRHCMFRLEDMINELTHNRMNYIEISYNKKQSGTYNTLICNIVKWTLGAKEPYHDGDVVAGIKLFFPSASVAS